MPLLVDNLWKLLYINISIKYVGKYQQIPLENLISLVALENLISVDLINNEKSTDNDRILYQSWNSVQRNSHEEQENVGALNFILPCIWINCVSKENYGLLFDFVQRCKVGRQMFAEKLKPFAQIHTIQKEENENRAQSCGGKNKQAVLHCSANITFVWTIYV